MNKNIAFPTAVGFIILALWNMVIAHTLAEIKGRISDLDRQVENLNMQVYLLKGKK